MALPVENRSDPMSALGQKQTSFNCDVRSCPKANCLRKHPVEPTLIQVNALLSGAITLINDFISATPLTHALKEDFFMNTNPKTKSTADAPEQFRERAEKGATRSKEAIEKMSAASGQAAEVMQSCYLAAVKGVQDYNNKLIEFTHANTKTAFDFAQRMSSVKSPSEFVELSTDLAQQQLTTLTEQTKQLAALAQQATFATAEPLKTSLVPSST
jgi:phasin